jgi:hypothetical protein
MTDASSPVNSIVLNFVFWLDAAMKPFATISLAAFALVACAPLSIYYRPGVSVSRMQNDQTNCQVHALKSAPVANEIRQRPPIFFPGRQICGAGGCYYTAGYWVDGGIYSVDVNSDLRGRVEEQCMAGKGYQPISVPLCSSAVKSAVPPKQTQTLPKLTEAACAIRYDDGSWQIVNPISSKSGG